MTIIISQAIFFDRFFINMFIINEEGNRFILNKKDLEKLSKFIEIKLKNIFFQLQIFFSERVYFFPVEYIYLINLLIVSLQ